MDRAIDGEKMALRSQVGETDWSQSDGRERWGENLEIETDKKEGQTEGESQGEAEWGAGREGRRRGGVGDGWN